MKGHDDGRREFLRSCLRWVLLAGAVGGTGALTARKGETCANKGICSGCPTFEGCGLPQALSAKEARNDGR